MSTKSIADLNLDDEEENPRITPETGAKATRTLSTNVASGSDVQGEINSDDLRLPRVNLVQRQSNESLVDSFDFGDIVLNKTVQLAPINTALDGVIIAKIKKQYQEKLPWDPSRAVAPRIYNTAGEIRDAGGSTVFGDDHFFEKIAHMLLIIPAPTHISGEDLEELFYYEFEGQKYTRALFTAGGTGFNLSARDVFTTLSTPSVVTKGIRFCKWQMKSIKQANPKNSWFGLSLKRSGSNSDEMIEWTKSVAP